MSYGEFCDKMCCSEVCCLSSYVPVVCFSLQVARTKNVIGDPSYFMDKVKKVGQVNLRLKLGPGVPSNRAIVFCNTVYILVCREPVHIKTMFFGGGGQDTPNKYFAP